MTFRFGNFCPSFFIIQQLSLKFCEKDQTRIRKFLRNWVKRWKHSVTCPCAKVLHLHFKSSKTLASFFENSSMDLETLNLVIRFARCWIGFWKRKPTLLHSKAFYTNEKLILRIAQGGKLINVCFLREWLPKKWAITLFPTPKAVIKI